LHGVVMLPAKDKIKTINEWQDDTISVQNKRLG
jgi:hypothetical protein